MATKKGIFDVSLNIYLINDVQTSLLLQILYSLPNPRVTQIFGGVYLDGEFSRSLKACFDGVCIQ